MDEHDTSIAERLKALLASGDTKSVLELFASLEQRVDEEVTRANEEATRANEEAARANEEAARADGETTRANEFVEQADGLQDSVHRLECRVKHLTRLLYGRRSETLTSEELAQLVLAFEGTVTPGETPTTPTPTPADERDEEIPDGDKPPKQPKKRRPNHRGRTALLKDLERRIHEVCVPDDERGCTACGEPMTTIGHLDHESVEYIPARFVVDVQRREKVACKNKSCLGEAVTAERSKEPTVATRVGASVLAHLVESKTDDALPLYRQQHQFHRLGFDIPLNTLYSNWNYTLDLLFPVAVVTLSVVLDDPIVRIDDTGMPVLDKTHPKGKYRGHLWAFKGSTRPLVAYQFTKTWTADEIRPWIEAVTGFIQVDDYKGYSTLIDGPNGDKVKLVPDDRRLGCMMHVRRRFYEAFTLGDKRAAPAVQWIRKIYKIEAKAKAQQLDAKERLALRTSESRPLLEEFFAWVTMMKPKLGKTTKLAQAVRYSENQRAYVERCFTDGRFEIDNGEIERVLKKACVGRRNFLHAGSLMGGQRLATAYTLVQSCRALGISSRDYLIDVIEKVAGNWPMSRICELVPDRWAHDRGLLTLTDEPGQEA